MSKGAREQRRGGEEGITPAPLLPCTSAQKAPQHLCSIEALLQQETGVSEETLQKAKERLGHGKELGEILQEMGVLDASTWAQVMAEYYGLPYLASLSLEEDTTQLLSRVPLNFAKRYHLLPLKRQEEGILVAVADPRVLGALDDLRLLFRVPVRAVVAPLPIVQEAINRGYDRVSQSAQELVADLEGQELDRDETGWQGPQDLLEVEDEAPIIRLVNSLFYQAVKERASDIHIEPFETDLLVRFRIDGILYDTLSPPKRVQPLLVSRVKILAGLIIAEKRLPQDGRIRLKVAGRDIDIRVSVVPTAFGERVVLRLLDRSAVLLGLEELGLAARNLELLGRLVHQSHGILLVTGPTGSGKTTTLYAALSKINTSDKNIITIEDPIEYQLRGIGQMQVNPKIDLTFTSGLRSILRQDPDVMMIGEIRDVETAEIAIQAALTGHLVFSTLHTNDSFGAVTRLLDLGIEPYLVSSSVLAIMAQRLVRRVCPGCRSAYVPVAEELRELGLSPEAHPYVRVYSAGEGCEQCRHKGYRGRTGIHELLLVDDDIRALIMRRADATTIRRCALNKGMPTLRDDGAKKVLAGVTTTEEVLRVTQEELV